MSTHIDPYITHGQKSNRIKKMTVSVPIDLYNVIQQERKRRIDNKMRHATASELLCEAFAHAFTGQPLPTDEELIRYLTKAKAEKYKYLRKEMKDNAIDNALSIAKTFISFPDTRRFVININEKSSNNNEAAIYFFRFLLIFTTFVISETSNSYYLRGLANTYDNVSNPGTRYPDFLNFLDYSANNDQISKIIQSIKSFIINEDMR